MNNYTSRKSITAMSPIIYEIVSSGGSVRLDIRGTSMMPLLRSERDAVLLKKAENIVKYDVVLFKKKDGKIALHRIVDIKDDTYTIIGDNQYKFDYAVSKEALIAKAVEFHRGNHRIGETTIRVFGLMWYATYPLRNFTRKGLTWIKRHLPACIRSLKNKFR